MVFTINYDIIFIDNNGNEKYKYTNNEQNVVLKHWEHNGLVYLGKKYTYTFTIGLKPIKMGPTTDRWSNSGYDTDVNGPGTN